MIAHVKEIKKKKNRLDVVKMKSIQEKKNLMTASCETLFFK